jgi:protein involved in polysaccharide export with SLBB domain
MCLAEFGKAGLRIVLVVLAGQALGACSTSHEPHASAGLMSPVPAEQLNIDESDARKLNQIMEARSDAPAVGEFPLGPGDLLEISVPIEELEHREVRVSSRNTVELPLVGEMNVAGMSEEQFTDALRQRLSVYMYNPPVSVFARSLESRKVAVTGAVQKPGLYTLRTRTDTLIDVLGDAGGMSADAANEVIFIPNQGQLLPGESQVSDSIPGSASPAALSDNAAASPMRLASLTALQPAGPEVASAGAANTLVNVPVQVKQEAIAIDLNNAGMRGYLDIPARPGDVLIVPAAGQVTVGGWVATPGAYKLTPNMTALSAISSAGGALFSSAGEILRTSADGKRISVPLDLSAIKKGQQSDVAVASGDVVLVDRSAAGAAPYLFYEIFTKFGTGMYIPVP